MGDIIILKKKEINKKHLFIYMDEIIIKSLNEGNIHFFLTINFKNDVKEKKELIKEVKRLEKNLEEIELISWYNIVSEKNKKGNYHLHFIIGIKSLLGYNNAIENNIKFFLVNNYEIDTKINTIWDFINIKKSWRYLYKEENIKKENNINILKVSKEQEEIFYNFEKIIKINKIENNKLSFLRGVKIIERNYNERQLMFIWEYYLIMNNLVIYKDKIYKKIENTMISYKEFEKIEFLYDNFDEVIFFFKKNFKFQFSDFDELNFVSKFIKNKSDKMIRFKEFSKKKVDFNFNILEFNDGIYSIIHNKFIRKNKFNKKNDTNLESFLINKEILTIKNYNYSYENIKEPENWLKSIEKVIGLKKRGNSLKDKIADFLKEDDIKWLLIHIANVFHHKENELKKQSTLYLWGPSNTGKTTLVINLFVNFFGKENVGLISGNKNFEGQDFIDKKIIVYDELDASKMNMENLKKILSKELILVEKKGKDPVKLDSTPSIIASNYNIEFRLNIDENKEAILNRLKVIKFCEKFEGSEIKESIKEKLIEEEGKIIVYCNRVYFNWIKKGKKTRMDDIKLIEKI